MSTENKKIYRKTKKITEKDKRMALLEKEIARLENENSKLKLDGVYESRLASFSGAPHFATEFPSLNRNLQSVANKHASQKPDENSEGTSRSKNSASNASRKKKLRTKLMKIAKKQDAKK